MKMLARVVGGAMAVVACSVCGIQEASAASQWVDDTASSKLGPMLRDEIRDVIYVADPGDAANPLDDEVLVIHSGKLNVPSALPCPIRSSTWPSARTTGGWLWEATGS